MSRLKQVPVKDDRRLLKTPWVQVLLALAVLGVSLPSMLNAQTQAVSFGGTLPASLGSGFISPAGVAVDASGDVFVTDIAKNTVQEIVAVAGSIPAANPTILTLGGGFFEPYGVAVDASGDVFVADTANSAVKEIVAVNGSIPATGATIVTLGSGFNLPTGVAVDAFGDVFVADQGNNAVKEIVAVNGIIPAANPTILTLGSGFNQPFGVAVDASGDVFLSDSSNNAVKEIIAVNGIIPAVNPTILSLGSGFLQPDGLAVDGSGDVFVANFGSDAVEEIVAVNGSIPAANPTILILGSGFTLPTGVAVGTAGVVFVADYGNHLLEEIQLNSVNFGGINICPANQTTPAPCSTALTLNYNVTTAGTLGTPLVTGGGDFALAAGSSCTGAVTVGVCTVNVTFTPLFTGLRGGGIEVTDANNQPLVSTLVSGIGVGPQIGFSPSGLTTIPDDDVVPFGIAVDDAGNVFVSDDSSLVLELPASGGAPVQVGTGLLEPYGLATDGFGDVFIADAGNDRVEEVTPLGTQITVGSGLSGPEGVWVDRAGNVFIADSGNNRVVEVPANGGPQITLPTTGLADPYGVGVDPLGNIYIADTDNAQVVELPVGGGPQITVGSGFSSPVAVAFDAAGDVLVADGLLYEIPVGGGLPIQLDLGFDVSTGVAVNGAGGIFNADETVLLLQRVQPPSLNFATTAVGTTSPDSPQSVEIQNIGNAPLILSGLTVGTNFVQVAGSGTPPDCAVALSLAADALCNLSIDFTPTTTGIVQSPVTLIDNSLNGNPATQAIPLTNNGGILATPVTMTVTGPLPLPLAPGQTGTFTVSEVDANGNLVAGDDDLVTLSLSGEQANTYQLALTNGQGILQINLTVAGAYALAATDATDGLTAADNFTVQAPGAPGLTPTTLTLTATPAGTSSQGQSVTLTATLAPYNGTAFTTDGETVTFLNGGTAIGTGTLASGVAAFTTGALPGGADSLTASYPGDANLAASASQPLSYEVAPPAATVTTLAVTAGGTAVTTVAPGTAVALTATVTIATGAPVSPGIVLFCDATALICEDSALLGTAQLTAAGTATFTFIPGIGSHSYKAVFVGTAGNVTSISAAQPLTVSGTSPTTTSIAASGTPGDYTLTGTVVGTRGPYAQTSVFVIPYQPWTDTGIAVTAGQPLVISATGEMNWYTGGCAGTSCTNGPNGSNAPNPCPGVGAVAPNLVCYSLIGMIGTDGTPFQVGASLNIASPATGELFLGVNDGNFGDNTLGWTAFVNVSPAPTGSVNFVDTTNGNASLGTAAIGTATLGLNFVNAATPAAPGNPTSIVTGDFNGDGKPDLAIGNLFSTTLTILLGNGDGTYTNVTGPTVGAGSYELTAGDFNSDGKTDLAVVNTQQATVAILLGNGDGTFVQGSGIGLEGAPGGIVTGDFNADGKLDLAVSLATLNTVSIFLGNGDGSFDLTSNPSTQQNPGAMAVGDWNGDGFADLAVTNAISNTITVYLSSGDGTFTTFGSVATGIDPQAIATGDFDGDGKADLAVANHTDATVSIFLGDGTGNFTAKSLPATGAQPFGIALADFNGDGILDLATANYLGTTASVLLGVGDGTFNAASTVTVGNAPQAIVAGDWNGDGVPDFATANAGGNTASILLAQHTQTATATLANVSVPGTGTHTVEASYPGDGNFAPSVSATTAVTASLATTTLALSATPVSSIVGQPVTMTATLGSTVPVGTATGNVTFFAGATPLGTAAIAGGVATFTTVALPVGEDSLTAAYAGDANFAASTSSIFAVEVSNLTAGEIATVTTLALAPAVATTPAGTVVTLTASVTGNAAPVFPGLVTFCDAAAPPCANSAVVGTAQLTATGTAVLKLVPGIGIHSYYAVFAGTTNDATSDSGAQPQLLTVTGVYPTTTAIAATGAPGDYTLTGTVTGTGSVSLIPTGVLSFLDTTNANAVLGTAPLGAGTPAQALVAGLGSPLQAGAAPYAVATGDFNGDGFTDFAVENYEGDTISVFLGNGNGTFQAQVTYAVGVLPEGIAAADLNGDGKLDLIVTNAGEDTVGVLLGNGDGTFQAQVTYGAGAEDAGLVVADLNHDGIPDIATSNFAGGNVSILLGNGDGTFQAQVNYPAGGEPRTLTAGSFDHTGNVDLAVANQADNTVSILLGNGDGTFQAQVTYPTGTQPQGVAAADFNADGNADLAIGNSGDATAGILLGNGDGTFQAMTAYGTGNAPLGVVVADFNKDGKTDIALENFNDNTESVLLGNGNGSFQAQAIFPTGTTPYAAAVGDFNGDGLPDLVISNFGGGNETILLDQISSTATVTLANVAVTGAGTHNVAASYAGDANFAASVSGTTVPLTGTTAAPAATTLTLSATPLTSTFGQPVTMTATLGSAAPIITATGNVTFFAGATQLGTAAIAGGVATFTTSALAVGVNNLTASYAGDANFAASTSAIFAVTVNAVTGALTITGLTPNTAVAGVGDLAVTINGTGFVAGAAVTVNGTSQAATFVSATQLTTTITAAELSTVGTLTVTVVNPGGAASNAVAFSVTAQPVQVTPATLDFGNVTVGTTSAAQVVTVTNTLAGALTINQIALQLGADPNDFVQTNNCPASLASGASCQISITFTPGAVGTRVAGLGVYDNSPPQPQIVQVTGNGTGGILQVSPGNLKTIAGNGTQGFSGDGGAALNAELYAPNGVAFDAQGDLYIADQGNSVIRKVDTTGNITTVAGNGTAGFSGDGGPATSAELFQPNSVTVDAAGNVYIEDTGNNRVRKVDLTGVITTIAGNGTQGYSGDNGLATAAALNENQGARFDAAGNLYVPQCLNAAVRKIATNGIITTVAGNGTNGFSGDGGLATAAQLACPSGVAIDAAGELFIADFGNSLIRKVDVNGIITTIAGNGVGGFSGDGGAATAAEINLPNDVDVDAAGNIYIADDGNNRIRKVDATGVITTVVGGLNNAGSAGVNSPLGLTLDGAGNLYFSDAGNNAVREVFPAGALTFAATTVGVAAAPQTVTLSNIGNLPVTIASQASFALSGDATDFSLVGGTCLQGATLAANGGACTLQIGFTPTAVGLRNLTVSVADTAVYSPQSFQISGTGVAPAPPGGGVVLTSISPAGAPAGSADTTLTVVGANFTATSVVNFGATALATTYGSATQLTAVIPAALLATAGNVAVTVTDVSSESVSQPQTFTVLPATLAVTFSGPPTSNPGEQPTLNFVLQQPYPVALSGTMTLTFTPDPGNPDSPQVQFATGGRTFNFTLPANTTDTPLVLVQSGTISGTISVSLTLTASGVNVTPPSLAPITIVVPKIAPTITALSFTTSGNVLTVVVTGYSSTREIQSATFSFTPAKGATLSQTTISVPASALFTTWFTSTTSDQFGSSFTYTQIFNLSGPATTVGGVGATLTNTIGTSAEVTAP